MARRSLAFVVFFALVVSQLPVSPAAATTSPQPLPLSQIWSDAGLITANDDWSAVLGIIGYRGDDLTTATGADPQTIIADGSATPVDVIANQANTAITTGGVAEFDGLSDRVVALQGSGTADAPHLVLTLDTSGASNITVEYNLRDIDGSADNAVQPVALQYRIGTSGNYTNLPAGFVADATSGPSLAEQVTPVSVSLPADANDQPVVQVRIITTNAVGSDEWVGVDDIVVASVATDAAPSVSNTGPLNDATGVALDANITVTFSEPVVVASNWYSISCTTSGGHAAAVSGAPVTFTIDPATNFASNEACTTTVFAANVTDQDSNDPPNGMVANYTFTFQTADVFLCGDPATFIHQVQGSGTATPMNNAVVTIEGVVVGDFQQPGGFSGFYVQEESGDADADPLTSEGIFVFNTAFAVSAGDVVRVRGRVTEFLGLTELTTVNALLVCSAGATVPATAVSLPVANTTDFERYEGMLVNIDQTLTATEVFNLGRFGEVSLSGAGRLFTPTAVVAPGAAAQAVLAQNNRSRIILDDGNNQQNIDPTRYPQGGLSASNTLRVGDTLAGLTGIMDFRFSNYRIQPVGPLSFQPTNPRTAGPASAGGNLKIASFNVLNFFNGDGLGGGFPTSRGAETPFELGRQLAKEVSSLTAIDADIVGLMEIENDASPRSAIEDLVTALNAMMGAGTYSFVDTGIIGTDEIKVALIYKPAAVTPVGAYKTLTSAVDPRFIDTLNRPSLAQTFEEVFTGQKLTVVVNHLKSKGSACAGDPDTGDGQGNCNSTRTAAAVALASWLATDPTGGGDPDFLIIGDLNSYTFEDPVTALTTSGYSNLVGQFGGLTAYSYVFNGESGYLDHALATSSLASQISGVADWHINPDEPTVLDYNTNFKTANQINTFYSPGPYRSSDHDPVIIGLSLATSAGTFANAEGAPAWPGGIRTKVNVNGMSGDAKGRVLFESESRAYEATRIDSIVASGPDATIFGAFGSALFRLDIHDGGQDGEDTLRLRATDGFDSGVLTGARGQLVVNSR